MWECRIRLEVDQGKIDILETVEDVHVLTGALKLFFRELKEPLIPWPFVSKLLLAANAEGEIHLISLVSRSVLHTLRTNRSVADIKFSPDSRHFAVARENNVFVYREAVQQTFKSYFGRFF